MDKVTNDEGNNREVTGAEVEAATNSAKLYSINNGIGSGNSKSSYVRTKTN